MAEAVRRALRAHSLDRGRFEYRALVVLTIGRGGVGGSYLSTAAGFEPAVALLLVDAWPLT